MRFIAHIPEPFREDSIEWLVLEIDKHGTNGIFIFSHKSLDEECEYDDWYEDIDKTFTEARRRWGVRKSDWTTEI